MVRGPRFFSVVSAEARSGLALALVMLLLANRSASAAIPGRILVTTFDPFKRSSANNSQAVGAELQKLFRKAEVRPEVIVCNLPVIYDQAAEQARRCIERTHPDWVVSLGEAGCSLKLETAANNLDYAPGSRDNSGQVRTGVRIVPGAPERLGFAFPVAAMLGRALERKWERVTVSKTPGNFVCNNLAFRLTRELEASAIPFTFIHVPHSNCAPEVRNPAQVAARIHEMLEAAMDTAAGTGGLQRLPASRNEVEALLERALTASPASGEATLGRVLLTQYE